MEEKEIYFKNLMPHQIEEQSFKIINQILGDRVFNKKKEPVIKRVIHATADFSFSDTLKFSDNAVDCAIEALKNGADILTDTNMVKAGINKKLAEKFNVKIYCYMDDPEIAENAEKRKITRAAVCMEKSVLLNKNLIVAVGNAPTALLKLAELIDKNIINPALIIAVPVGFVNVIESKELIITKNIQYIVNTGRKGGSTVAAAIVNSLLKICDSNCR